MMKMAKLLTCDCTNHQTNANDDNHGGGTVPEVGEGVEPIHDVAETLQKVIHH